MKVWAILAIIWGHFFSEGYVYLYVFSVQVFCVISGFLYKKSADWKTCIRKCFWQLLVPSVIMVVIMHTVASLLSLGHDEHYNFLKPWFPKLLLTGDRWCMGPCWYFYSLMVMRLIMQLLPEKKWAYALLFAVLSAGAVYVNYIGFVGSNAIVNVLVCMPFFLIGVFLKPFKTALSSMHNYLVEIVLLVVAVVLVILCGNYNGYVWMYLNGFGNNYLLYILGGMAGACMLYVVSLWLGRLKYRSMVETLAKGSIMIIGLHIIIVKRLTQLPDRLWPEDFALAVLILLAFVPLIRIAELCCPVLLGKGEKES